LILTKPQPKKALICGVSGQDGAYLAQLLLEKEYEVFGSSRDAQASSSSNLRKLDIFDRVSKESISPTDFRSVLQVLARIEPGVFQVFK
jgi:GDPmannose 4,6-dehydratase